LIELPGPGIRRGSMTSAGYFPVNFRDYSAPLGEPLDQRLIARQQADQEDPNAEMSEAGEPLVYYVDRGAPETIRTALWRARGGGRRV